MKAENNGKSEEQILQERIVALERSLQMERMRCRALEKVIEIVEREEGISILKKESTLPSGLKDEWLYHQAMFRDYVYALREIGAMIDFYNNVRPHMSIGNKNAPENLTKELPSPEELTRYIDESEETDK